MKNNSSGQNEIAGRREKLSTGDEAVHKEIYELSEAKVLALDEPEQRTIGGKALYGSKVLEYLDPKYSLPVLEALFARVSVLLYRKELPVSSVVSGYSEESEEEKRHVLRGVLLRLFGVGEDARRKTFREHEVNLEVKFNADIFSDMMNALRERRLQAILDFIPAVKNSLEAIQAAVPRAGFTLETIFKKGSMPSVYAARGSDSLSMQQMLAVALDALDGKDDVRIGHERGYNRTEIHNALSRRSSPFSTELLGAIEEREKEEKQAA